ncbi:MAG: hypothetical protein HN509_08220 [Halobacteriovoraceae bacterium]|jgi:hypothetical protein|nr:hypothetical protein [Halobacteriovoraceae bacterium]
MKFRIPLWKSGLFSVMTIAMALQVQAGHFNPHSEVLRGPAGEGDPIVVSSIKGKATSATVTQIVEEEVHYRDWFRTYTRKRKVVQQVSVQTVEVEAELANVKKMKQLIIAQHRRIQKLKGDDHLHRVQIDRLKREKSALEASETALLAKMERLKEEQARAIASLNEEKRILIDRNSSLQGALDNAEAVFTEKYEEKIKLKLAELEKKFEQDRIALEAELNERSAAALKEQETRLSSEKAEALKKLAEAKDSEWALSLSEQERQAAAALEAEKVKFAEDVAQLAEDADAERAELQEAHQVTINHIRLDFAQREIEARTEFEIEKEIALTQLSDKLGSEHESKIKLETARLTAEKVTALEMQEERLTLAKTEALSAQETNLNQAKAAEIKELRTEHLKVKEALNSAHVEATTALKDSHASKVTELNSAHEAKIEQVLGVAFQKHQEAMEAAKAEFERSMLEAASLAAADKELAIAELTAVYEGKIKELMMAHEQKQTELRENLMAEKIAALKELQGAHDLKLAELKEMHAGEIESLIAKHKEELSAKDLRIAELVAASETIEAKIATLIAENSELVGINAAMTAEVEELKASKIELDQKIAELTGTVESQKQEIVQKDEVIVAKDEDLKKKDKELRTQDCLHQEKIGELEESVERSIADKKKITMKLKELEEKIASYETNQPNGDAYYGQQMQMQQMMQMFMYMQMQQQPQPSMSLMPQYQDPFGGSQGMMMQMLMQNQTFGSLNPFGSAGRIGGQGGIVNNYYNVPMPGDQAGLYGANPFGIDPRYIPSPTTDYFGGARTRDYSFGPQHYNRAPATYFNFVN